MVSRGAGGGFAGVLQVVAVLATQAGSAGLGRVVDWPTTLLQGLTASNDLAVVAGFPLGGAVYSSLAYMVFRSALKEES